MRFVSVDLRGVFSVANAALAGRALFSKIFTVFFFCLSVSLVAASADSDQNLAMQRCCEAWLAKLPSFPEDHKTLEIKFVRQDGTICGAFWDVFKLVDHDRIWRITSYDMPKSLLTDKPIDERGIFQELKKMRSLLLERHDCVRGLCNLDMITAQDMSEVIRQNAHPWAVVFTSSALDDCVPGTLIITVVGTECCLVHPPATVAVQEQTDVQTGNQQTLDAFPEQRDDLAEQWERFSEELDSLGQRIRRLERFLNKP